MEGNKDLNYWKNNAEEDYMHTPISVLRYITELEQQVKSFDLADVVGRSEQLKAFREWWNKDNEGVCTTITHKDIDRYLKSL